MTYEKIVFKSFYKSVTSLIMLTYIKRFKVKWTEFFLLMNSLMYDLIEIMMRLKKKTILSICNLYLTTRQHCYYSEITKKRMHIKKMKM